MCGIFGFVLREPDKDILEKSNLLQSHRGPDDNGIFLKKVGKYWIGFSHQRLSIIDLSSNGAQPMTSLLSQNHIVYNGEIYNYKELSLGEGFDSTWGDTRVLLEMLSKYDIEVCKSLNGMWAFAHLNEQQKILTLSRDRFGEKPLYYCHRKEGLYFSSELKTLLKLVPGKFNLNFQVIGEFLSQGLTNFSQNSILEGVTQVKPGCNLSFNLDSILTGIEDRYWSPPRENSYNNTESASVEELRYLFEDSVKLRLRSDVPVAVLLSGGIDSSSITASMTSCVGNSNVTTLSAVSDKNGFDESVHINSVNSYLGVKPKLVCLNPTASDALNLVTTAVYHNDMPIGDFSNVAHLLLMREAASIGTKVVLSGQGADELFCGYKKYLGFYILTLLRNRKYFQAQKVLTSFLRNGAIINQFKLSEAKRYLPFFNNKLGILGERMNSFEHVPVGLQHSMRLIDRQIYDLEHTSVPALTHYEDRMSMANGIEIRLPFLDHRLAEFALRLPENFKINNGWTKYILRKALENKLPSDIVWRKDKQGFLNPQAKWLKTEWREVVNDHFSSDSLISTSGIINQARLRKSYDHFCNDHNNIWYREIFSPFSLEIWLRANIEDINL